MPKSDPEHRIGLYECKIGPDRHFGLGESLKKLYYERFTQDLVKSTIIPDLRDMKRRGSSFDYPILVVSWRLYLKKSVPLCEPPYKLKGALWKIREALGMSPQSEPKSETRHVVIDEKDNIFPVDSNDKTFLPTWPTRSLPRR